MENKNQEKELDLLDLIAIFWNFLKSYFFKPLAALLKIAFKRWYVLLGAVLLGLVVSVVVPKCIIKKNPVRRLSLSSHSKKNRRDKPGKR